MSSLCRAKSWTRLAEQAGRSAVSRTCANIMVTTPTSRCYVKIGEHRPPTTCRTVTAARDFNSMARPSC
jgi:hypothetical protein